MQAPGPAATHAEVVVDSRTAQPALTFTYSIPDALRDQLAIGQRVLVPFGSRQVPGFVINLSSPPAEELGELGEVKPLEAIIEPEPALTPLLAGMAVWVARRYHAPVSEVVRAMLPPVAQLFRRGPRTRARAAERELQARPPLPPSGVSASPSALALTAEQDAVLQTLLSALLRPTQPVLLQGVTGSGKTEIYLRLLQEVVAQGGQAAMLVPEISLTPQAVERLEARLPGQVAVLHSALTPAERFRAWRRLRRGEAAVALGSRSAVFAPLQRPLLYIIDEEHESSYKQDRVPRYHARAVAAELARRAGALLVLGSATPDVESRFAAESGSYQLLRMERRFSGQPLPRVELVDLREELKVGNRGIFSTVLHRELEANLEAGEQTILLLNRRGAAAFVLCRACGFVVNCASCSIAMVLHDAQFRPHLSCHWCGSQAEVPRQCPECASGYIKGFGVGTERVEAELRALFPSVTVVRMDRDTTSARDSHAELFGRFARGEAEVLVGTQMVAKGFDLPRVSLVGVISADTALHIPDYRAGEATFQLLSQVAGRAGRGADPAAYAHGARVVVQTYTPEHYAVTFAARHDYEGFYASELEGRRSFAFPPYSQLAVLTFSHRLEESARSQAEEARTEVLDKIGSLPAEASSVEVLGPTPAVPARLRGQYRWQLTIKGRDLTALYGTFKSGWSIDVDPRF